MSLIEWTRLEPGQVEAVVALLTNREHPTTVRITPSRGDGGVDILGRGLGATGGDVVYQVKSYTEGLSQRQKDSIEDSLKTVQTDLRWDGLNIEQWFLVTPWNPSPEAENWLHDLGAAAGIPTVWLGLDHVEQLAAKYPDVIDYYLNSGKQKIADAQAELLALIGLENLADNVSVEEATTRIQRSLGVLNHDPFYRFEYRFGEGTHPEPRDRPGLVMHTLRVDETGQWVVVDVIARCSAAFAVAPITIGGKVQIPEDTELADQWTAFVMYGAPVTLPAGTITGQIVAPGGLGSSLDGAILKTGPAADADLGQNPDMHVEILAPDGTVLAETDIERTERSTGMGGGIRAVLRETHGIFTIEDRYDLKNQKTSRSFNIGDITDLPVEVARAGIEVVSQLHAPNSMRVSTRHTPPEHGVTDENIDFGWDADITAYLGATLRILQTLCTLQDHTRTALKTPNFTAIPKEQFKNWRIAAGILNGDEVTGTYEEGFAITVDFDTEVTPGDEELGILLPHTVRVGDQVVELGQYELHLLKPTLVSRTENEDGSFAHTFTTEERQVIHRRPAADAE